MKKSFVIAGLAVCVVVLVAVFIWQTSSRRAIIGAWELENVVGLSSTYVLSHVEFYSDGRGRSNGTPFTWTSERSLLRVTSSYGETILYEYRIAGSTLTFIHDDRGNVYVTYRKVR